MTFATRKVEDCFDGSQVFDYLVGRPLTVEAIRDLGDRLGKLTYYPEFPRPFFRAHAENGMQVKGVQGDREIRVIFPGTRTEQTRVWFEQLLDRM